MSDESYGILGLFAAMLSWVGINATWTHNLQKKVGRCAEKYVAKDDFQIFRTEQRADMKGIHDRLDKFIERREKQRD